MGAAGKASRGREDERGEQDVLEGIAAWLEAWRLPNDARRAAWHRRMQRAIEVADLPLSTDHLCLVAWEG